MANHPKYLQWLTDYEKFRLTMEGGPNFVTRYLIKFSDRETEVDFTERKKVTPCAAYAKSGIREIANSIFQRISDVVRVGGSKKYLEAISGVDARGVDLTGNTMESFIASKILLELLSMGKVGVFVDMPAISDFPSLYETKDIRPYIYTYSVEQILNYAYDEFGRLKALQLEQCSYDYDLIGLPISTKTSIRKIFKSDDGKVIVESYSSGAEDTAEQRILDIPEIPFIILELPDSLLVDVADYQIALTNLISSDIYYGIKANFPFYVEESDNRSIARYIAESENEAFENTDSESKTAVGPMKGRQYAQGTNKPDFIHPSSEPLKANMEKEEQMKREIRNLLHLAVQNLQPVRASADSKDKDVSGLEAGLSRIGLEIERFENKFADLWSGYMDEEAAEVRYPKRYQLQTDDDRLNQAKELQKLQTAASSMTYQREVSKNIATMLLGHKISEDTLEKIKKEVDAAEVVNVDTDVIHQDLENGILSRKTAAKAKGYPASEVETAQKEHTERLKLIQISQAPGGGAARGINDTSPDPSKEAKEEKKVNKDEPKDTDRGEGK
jgi:hypothetical protein